jgi:large subunit ribosomal protein L9
MKVLLRRNVGKLGKIGDVVEVKNGYARNYLIPQGVAYQPTGANIRAVEREKAKYLENLAREREVLAQRAQLLDGKEVTIASLANEQGRLYGAVGPAQIAAALTEAGLFVEAGDIVLDEPIRQLDKYEVAIRFDEDIRATVQVWVVPVRGVEVEPQPSDGTPDAAEPEGEWSSSKTDETPEADTETAS